MYLTLSALGNFLGCLTKDLFESSLIFSKIDTNSSMIILYICIYGKSFTPYTPYFIDGGIRYASVEMGLNPSKYPQNKTEIGF